MIKRPSRSGKEIFQRELELYRLAITNFYKEHPQKSLSLLAKQIIFWLEGAHFLISEMEIWGQEGDDMKYEASALKVQEALDHLNELVVQLTEEQPSDFYADQRTREQTHPLARLSTD